MQTGAMFGVMVKAINDTVGAGWAFWAAGAGVVLVLHPSRARGATGHACRPWVAPVDRGRLAGLVLAVVCAHVGWVGVHAFAIQSVHGAWGVLTALAQLNAGVSVLFVPFGPLCVRALRRDPMALLDADLRAWVAGLAVARLGCVWVGCCGGRAASSAVDAAWALASASASLRESAGALAHPVALYECMGALCLARLLRRPGLGGAAIAGFAALRWGLDPLRAPPPHAGAAGWVPWLACGWISFGSLWTVLQARRSRRLRRACQKSSPSSKPSRGPPDDLPSPMAPTPPAAFSSSTSRSFGVPSCSGRPRGSGVRRARKTPVRWPSRS